MAAKLIALLLALGGFAAYASAINKATPEEGLSICKYQIAQYIADADLDRTLINMSMELRRCFPTVEQLVRVERFDQYDPKCVAKMQKLGPKSWHNPHRHPCKKLERHFERLDGVWCVPKLQFDGNFYLYVANFSYDAESNLIAYRACQLAR